MNTLNNYISEKLFVDTEEEISSAINQPLIIKTIKSLMRTYTNCNVQINDNNEIFIDNGLLILNAKNIRILNKLFKKEKCRITYCESIFIDKIDTLPEWINNLKVFDLRFGIFDDNVTYHDMEFTLTNEHEDRNYEPRVTFIATNASILPDTKNIIINNNGNSYVHINLQNQFDFNEINYNFFNGIKILGDKIKSLSLYQYNIGYKLFSNEEKLKEYIAYNIKSHKELYNFYKKYCDQIQIDYFIDYSIKNFIYNL